MYININFSENMLKTRRKSNFRISSVKLNTGFLYPIEEIMLTNKNLELSDTIILFDRDLGVSIFQNYKGYNNLVDDAEWLLERTSQKSRGFIIRPVRKCQKCGIWIGEYDYRGNQINRQELLFDSNTEIYCTMIENFARKRVSEKKIMEKFSLENVGRSAGVFNENKLIWLNSFYIRNSDNTTLLKLLIPFLEKKGFFV
ncbi:MAG: hypothetical protein QXL24_08845, partial [Candidatus Jordarchaeaceae archaeon]